MSKVRTVYQLVEAFGGNAAMAEWADVGVSTVCNWKELNSLPRGYHLRLFIEAQTRGIDVDAKELFGLDPDRLGGKPRSRPKHREEHAA